MSGYPAGGLTLTTEYRSGNQSSSRHLPAIRRVIAAALGCREVFEGSLNFHAPEHVAFPEPAKVLCDDGHEWWFVGVVIEEAAFGIAARRPPPEEHDLIEVFACEKLAPALGLKQDTEVRIRLLPAHLIPGLAGAVADQSG